MLYKLAVDPVLKLECDRLLWIKSEERNEFCEVLMLDMEEIRFDWELRREFWCSLLNEAVLLEWEGYIEKSFKDF